MIIINIIIIIIIIFIIIIILSIIYPSAVFIALKLNWPEANQVAID